MRLSRSLIVLDSRHIPASVQRHGDLCIRCRDAGWVCKAAAEALGGVRGGRCSTSGRGGCHLPHHHRQDTHGDDRRQRTLCGARSRSSSFTPYTPSAMSLISPDCVSSHSCMSSLVLKPHRGLGAASRTPVLHFMTVLNLLSACSVYISGNTGNMHTPNAVMQLTPWVPVWSKFREGALLTCAAHGAQGTLQALGSIARTDGARGLFRGLGPTACPSTCNPHATSAANLSNMACLTRFKRQHWAGQLCWRGSCC